VILYQTAHSWRSYIAYFVGLLFKIQYIRPRIMMHTEWSITRWRKPVC